MRKFIAFGKGDMLALGKPLGKLGQLSISTRYTQPNMGAFFSHAGFAYPLHLSIPPFFTLADNLFPVNNENLKLHFEPCRYLIVDHNGLIWRAVVQFPTDNKFDQLYIRYDFVYKSQGWWVVTGQKADEPDEDADMLLGFLDGDPTKAALDKYWYKHCHGESLEWLDIPTIVATLREKHPKPKTGVEEGSEFNEAMVRMSHVILDKVIQSRNNGDKNDKPVKTSPL